MEPMRRGPTAHLNVQIFKNQNLQGLGGDLVAVETSAEYEFIVRTLKEDTMLNWANNNWLLGGKRTGVGNDFIWVQTGQPIGFANWGASYDTNSRRNQANTENVYVAMGSVWSGRKWYVSDRFNRYKKFSFICEAS